MLLITKLYSTLLWAHGLQHTSFLCPHYLAICSHSCPLIWWCYLSISSSATHFSGFSAMGFSRQERWSGFHFLLQGIFPTQGSNPCLLHWQADSLPRSHQGSPSWVSFYLEAQETATGPQKTKSEGTSLYCIWYYRKKREKEGRGWGGASRGSIEETVALLLSQVLYLSGLFAVNRNHFYFKQKIP